jgi:hypothetical protein
MLQEHYSKILDELTEWRIGVDNYFKNSVPGRPRLDKKENEASNPINGYPVVLSVKAIAKPCEWCEGTCTKEKTYRRSLGSNLWTAKCQDCGETRNIHTSQINFTK